ncbi:histidinol-phosphatase [Ohtaekwangia koreensis]|uniref:Histidinol-phosphatase n=1 Tax=Ohtaekwangia koreensis TaxID=688867 RepID=A0A1T5MGC0_9BACT|nr:histidinol-phosphatase [Ohtaekwangia koreensis]SKC87301.1 histidinol-phosphatase (PHP family) [Ohtaekwangia koreensis]
MWSNFHTHNAYCDGKGVIQDYIRKAEELEMLSLGISSHAPLPFANKWCMKPADLNAYLNELRDLKKKSPVDLYTSLEIDFIPGVISPNDFRDKLDYTVGSIHFVEQLPDGTRWEIDGTHAFFLEGYEKIFNNNIRDTLTRYYELTREMVATACPTVVGHLDKIKIQNVDGKLFSESDAWYQQEVKKTIDAIAASGAIIEVNTRGLYQKKSATTYPGPWILEYILQKAIPVTLSSDAHHPDDLVNQFSDTAMLLQKIGFKTLTILHEGHWQPFPYNEHGIIVR